MQKKNTSLEFMKCSPFANIVKISVQCIETPCLYVIPKVCISQKKQLNKHFTFFYNLGNESLKIGKNHNLGYEIIIFSCVEGHL